LNWWLTEAEVKFGGSEDANCVCALGPAPSFVRAACPTNPGPPRAELLSFSGASTFAPALATTAIATPHTTFTLTRHQVEQSWQEEVAEAVAEAEAVA
jgi:hypothetical protein